MLLCFLEKNNYFEKKSQQYFCIKPIFNEKLGKSFSIEIDRNGIPEEPDRNFLTKSIVLYIFQVFMIKPNYF